MILGVVADTHIPDRAPCLHPALLHRFQDAGVRAILHAGDICTAQVLHDLETIAPVYAVRGNRDLLLLRSLPTRRELNFAGVSIGLAHGHGRLSEYLLDRVRFMLHGLRVQHYHLRMMAAFPSSRIIVFGHTHWPINQWVNQQLLFNPGSACCPDHTQNPPSAGLLHLAGDGEVESEIFYFD